jgi:hypothetical protein
LFHFQFEPKKGQPNTALTADDIELREDSVAQTIVFFQGGGKDSHSVPVNIFLLFDCASVTVQAGSLDTSVFQDLLSAHPNAQVGIYGFRGGAARLAPLNRDADRLRKALDTPLFVHPTGTLLLEHIKQVSVDAASQGRGINLLVIISAAEPDAVQLSATGTRELFDGAVKVAQEAGVVIYPVLLKSPFGVTASDSNSSVGTGRGSSLPTSGTDSLRSVGDFKNLGPATGGEAIEVLGGSGFLPGVIKRLSKILQEDYFAGFVPTSTGGGKRHKVEVVLRDKNRGKIENGSRNIVH